MAVQMDVTLSDIGVSATIDQIFERSGDFSVLMDYVGVLLEQSARDRIEDTNIAPDGMAWPKSLRAQEDGGKTLYKDGHLAASQTHEAGRDQVAIGSNLIYAGVHQDGATITPKNGQALQFQLPDGSFVTVGKVTIPARPYLGISEQDEAHILGLTEDFLLGELS